MEILPVRFSRCWTQSKTTASWIISTLLPFYRLTVLFPYAFCTAWMFQSIYPVFYSCALVNFFLLTSGLYELTIYHELANNLDTIPAPLLDRMEVLEVSGYVSEEKAVIADKYLGPQAKEASGLKDADVLLEPSAVDILIKYYCRESGVRNLKKHIDKVRPCIQVNSISRKETNGTDRSTEKLHLN